MKKIFISYSNEDRGHINDLADSLHDLGYDVWWDREIVGGENFDEVIEHALKNADCVLVIWSNASLKSGWVRAEAEEALRQKKLVPIALELINPPLRFRQLQCIDLCQWFEQPLTDKLDNLLEAIDRTTEKKFHKTIIPLRQKIWERLCCLNWVKKFLIICLLIGIVSSPHLYETTKKFQVRSKLVTIIERDYAELNDSFVKRENQPITRDKIPAHVTSISQKLIDSDDELLGRDYAIVKYKILAQVYVMDAMLKIENQGGDQGILKATSRVNDAVFSAQKAFGLWKGRSQKKNKMIVYFEKYDFDKQIFLTNAIAYALLACTGDEIAKKDIEVYLNLLGANYLIAYPIDNEFLKPYQNERSEVNENAKKKPSHCV